MTLGLHEFSLLVQGTSVSLTLLIVLAIAVMHRAYGNRASQSILIYTGVWLGISISGFVARLPEGGAMASGTTTGAVLVIAALVGLTPALAYRFVGQLGGERRPEPGLRYYVVGGTVAVVAYGGALLLASRGGFTSATTAVTLSRLLQSLAAATGVGIVVIFGEWRGPHRRALTLFALGLLVIVARPFLTPLMTGVVSDDLGAALMAQVRILANTSPVTATAAIISFGTLLELPHARLRVSQEWMLHVEREIQVSRAAQDQGRIAAGLAHDIGNVLHVITLVASQLHERIAVEPWVRLTTLAERGRMLVHRMLDVARAVPTEPRDADLGGCVQSLLPVLTRLAPEHAIDLHVPGAPLLAHFDPEAVERVLMELVRNAADNAAAGSRITVAVDEVFHLAPPTRLRPAMALDGGRYACVSVEDEGHGIPWEHLPETSEWGISAFSEETLELGLPTYRALVRSMGGDLTIERSDAAGSVLRIWLRLTGATPTPAPDAA
jgi:signal transduction histidine kinase